MQYASYKCVIKVIVSVQSYPTAYDQVSELLQLLTRRSDALVESFFTVLIEDDQSHIVDYIMQQFNSYDDGETEVKTSVEEQSSTDSTN